MEIWNGQKWMKRDIIAKVWSNGFTGRDQTQYLSKIRL
jgi:hypothetical protein